jgi:hypothetical protein
VRIYYLRDFLSCSAQQSDKITWLCSSPPRTQFFQWLCGSFLHAYLLDNCYIFIRFFNLNTNINNILADFLPFVWMDRWRLQWALSVQANVYFTLVVNISTRNCLFCIASTELLLFCCCFLTTIMMYLFHMLISYLQRFVAAWIVGCSYFRSCSMFTWIKVYMMATIITVIAFQFWKSEIHNLFLVTCWIWFEIMWWWYFL